MQQLLILFFGGGRVEPSSNRKVEKASDYINAFHDQKQGNIHFGGLSKKQTERLDNCTEEVVKNNFFIPRVFSSTDLKLLYRAFVSNLHERIYQDNDPLDRAMIEKVNAFSKKMFGFSTTQPIDLKESFKGIIDDDILQIVCEHTETTPTYIDQDKHSLIHKQFKNAVNYVVYGGVLGGRVTENLIKKIETNLTSADPRNRSRIVSSVFVNELIHKFLDYKIGFTDLYSDPKCCHKQDKAIVSKQVKGQQRWCYHPTERSYHPITKINDVSINDPTFHYIINSQNSGSLQIEYQMESGSSAEEVTLYYPKSVLQKSSENAQQKVIDSICKILDKLDGVYGPTFLDMHSEQRKFVKHPTGRAIYELLSTLTFEHDIVNDELKRSPFKVLSHLGFDTKRQIQREFSIVANSINDRKWTEKLGENKGDTFFENAVDNLIKRISGEDSNTQVTTDEVESTSCTASNPITLDELAHRISKLYWKTYLYIIPTMCKRALVNLKNFTYEIITGPNYLVKADTSQSFAFCVTYIASIVIYTFLAFSFYVHGVLMGIKPVVDLTLFVQKKMNNLADYIADYMVGITSTKSNIVSALGKAWNEER